MEIPRPKSGKGRPPLIFFETGDGRSASAFLEHGFLEQCRARGAEVHVLSPGACYEPFVDRYSMPGVRFTYLPVEDAITVRHKALIRLEARIGWQLAKRGFLRTRHALWKRFGERLTAADGKMWRDLLTREKPDCIFSAHLNQGFGRSLLALGGQLGIPTFGNVFSWDHPFYNQQGRPDVMTCWSTVLRDWLINLRGFDPERIHALGAPVFDSYCDPANAWTRAQLCDALGLDPLRPIIVFATLGQVQMFWDETGTFEAFLKAFDAAGLKGPPQLVLRLHPISVDHYFDRFMHRKDIVVSRYSRYCPFMRWWPSREEMILAGNLMRHADVCISPGSTMTIEAAIFDTPTVVPTFNPIIPDHYANTFERNWLKKHFSFLLEADAVAVARTPQEAIAAVSRALSDPTWMQAGRRRVRDELIGPLDGKATERMAELAVQTARRVKKS